MPPSYQVKATTQVETVPRRMSSLLRYKLRAVASKQPLVFLSLRPLARRYNPRHLQYKSKVQHSQYYPSNNQTQGQQQYVAPQHDQSQHVQHQYGHQQGQQQYNQQQYPRPYTDYYVWPQPKPKGIFTFWAIFITNIMLWGAISYASRLLKRVQDPERIPEIVDKLIRDQAGDLPSSVKKEDLMKTLKSYVAMFGRLLENCTTSLSKIQNGDYLSFFLAPVSHISLPHLAINMWTFWTLARRGWIMMHPGAGLAVLAIGSGLSGNLGFYLQSYRCGEPEKRALGASGMTSGILTAIMCTTPLRSMSWMMIGAYGMQMSNDIFGVAYEREGSRIAHSGHLGGAAFGLVYGLLLRRRLVYR